MQKRLNYYRLKLFKYYEDSLFIRVKILLKYFKDFLVFIPKYKQNTLKGIQASSFSTSDIQLF